jgi:hypothetical protein
VCHRCRGLTSHHSFRVYLQGVSNDRQSDRLKALSVLLYILGLSYQEVADLLESLEQAVSKGTVFNNVQSAGTRAQQLRQAWLTQQAGKSQGARH